MRVAVTYLSDTTVQALRVAFAGSQYEMIRAVPYSADFGQHILTDGRYDVLLVEAQRITEESLGTLRDVQDSTGVPIVLLAPRGASGIARRACEAGLAGCAYFPLVTEELTTVIEMAVGSFATRRPCRFPKSVMSADKLQRFIEIANAGIWVTDEYGTTIFVNQYMAEMLGYTTVEILGMTRDDVMGESVLLMSDKRFLQQKRGTGETYECCLRKRDGSPLWVIVSATPVINDEGYFQGSFCMITDVSELKQAQHRIRASEHAFSMLSEVSEDIIMRFDRGFRCLYVNSAIEPITGISPAEFIGKTHRELGISAQKCQYIEEKIASVFALGKSVHTWYDAESLHGHTILDWRLFPEFDANGQVVSVVSSLRDMSELIHTTELLKTSEQRYRQLFETMSEGLALHEVIFDGEDNPVNSRILAVNPQFEVQTGLRADQVVGRLSREIFPEVDDDWFVRVACVALTGEPSSTHLYLSSLQRHFDCVVYRPAKGQFAVLSLDVTKRVAAETALARSRDYYRTLLDDFPSLIWMTDINACAIYYNNTWLAFTGRSLAQECGDGWLASVHPDDQERCATEYYQAIGRRVPVDMQYRLRCADGEYRWLRSIGHPYHDFDGKFAGYIGACYDITDQWCAEERIRESEQQLRQMLEHLSLAAVMVDTRGNIIYCNETLCELMGRSCAEVLRLNWFTDCIPDDAALRRALVPSLENGTFPVHTEYEIVTSSGTHRLIRWSNTPLCDSMGHTIGVTCLGEDVTERRRVERAIEQAKKEWELTFDTIPDLIAIVGTDSRIVRVNKALADRCRTTPQQLTGLPCSTVFCCERSRQGCHLRQIIGGNGIVNETLYHTALGSYLDLTTSPLHDASGQLTGCVHVARDITGLVKTTASLYETKETLQAIISASPLAIVTLDQQFNVTSWNPAAERLTGRTIAQMLGENKTLLTQERFDDLRELCVEVFQGRIITGLEIELERIDGTGIDVAVSGAPIYTAEGHVGGLVAILDDISDKKRIEQALHASEERYALAIKGIDAGIIDLAIEEDKVYLSPRCREILGLSPDGDMHIDSETWGRFIHPDDYERVVEERKACIDGNALQYNREHRVVLCDGSTRWVQSRGIVVRDSTGKALRLVGSINDITMQKRAEKQILRYQESLKKLTMELHQVEERERRRIAQGLHDEVGQLLTAVRFGMEALNRCQPNDRNRIFTDTVHHLDRAIEASRTLTFELVPPMLYELGIEAAISSLAEDIYQRFRLPVSVVVNSEPPIDKDNPLNALIFTAVRELLMNVVKHAHARMARIHIASNARMLTVTVADDGRGISENAAATKPRGKHGFGLFTIREQMQRLDGELIISSRPGQGTMTTLAIPLCSDR